MSASRDHQDVSLCFVETKSHRIPFALTRLGVDAYLIQQGIELWEIGDTTLYLFHRAVFRVAIHKK